ncbi:sulfotransferase [Glycomyces sp. L485]|uniref:sulfotransferase family protein n=1 Tax=Glycomyces sp. L485 TaxID=2909235 RepID=UPI001F4A1E61|nr:sulfotransferase [Glycomyces sp. L485]MCH7229824.1 sulfotransferase [Glycomyces sp. L485]
MHRVAPWLKAVNVVLTPTIVNRRNKVDKVIDRAVHEAEVKTDGTASGDEQFIEDMRFLLRCFADVDGLTPAGWVGTAGDIASRMENRFRIRKLHAQHPEIADEPIERPVVIVGMPRTGTTLTHHVLAQGADHRAPLMWELLHCDLGDIPEDVRAKYIKQAEQMVAGAEKASPMMVKIHKLGADKPEEDVFVLPHGLIYVVRAHMPRYEQWMLDRDYTADYQYLKQALQVLQYGRERRRWVLKSPAHLWSLETLLKVFPDAQIVWTHRDPATVMGSMCSLAETSMSVHVRDPDPHQIGRTWLGMLATGVGRARAARRNLSDDTIIDVPYRHLAEEPAERFPELYAWLSAHWGTAERRSLDQARTRAGGGGGHVYDLARYGISKREIQQAFGDYGPFVAELGES